jgi:low temperature requirement protein LtrA
MKRGNAKRVIFAIPAMIGVLSLFGLVAALTGDGVRDAISWAALAIPVIAVIWAMKARRS